MYHPEMYSFEETIKVVAPIVRIHTDNQFVVKGGLRGREWRTRPEAVDADLWRRVLGLLEDAKARGNLPVLKANCSAAKPARATNTATVEGKWPRAAKLAKTDFLLLPSCAW